MFKLIRARGLGFAAWHRSPLRSPAQAEQYRVATSGTVILPPEETHRGGLGAGDRAGRRPDAGAARLGRRRHRPPRPSRSKSPACARRSRPGSVLHGATAARGGDLAACPRAGASIAASSASTRSARRWGWRRSASPISAAGSRGCGASAWSTAMRTGASSGPSWSAPSARADQHMMEIAPVPYEAARNRPIGPGNFVQVRYRQPAACSAIP